MSKIEFLPVLDENLLITGKEERSKFHNNPEGKLLHPVIHLHLFNSKNELFLQLRPLNKIIQPGKWDTAVGGHVNYGESIETSLVRESKEEIGINPVNSKKIMEYIWETQAEKELVHVFLLNTKQIPKINKEELAGGQFWKLGDIKAKMNSGIFTENFIYEFKLLLDKGVIK